MINNQKKLNINVAVLLLNWNGVELTVPCIESLQKGTVIPTKIIVVDNASVDNSINILKEKFPFIELIKNQTNLGFTGGNNVGFEKTLADTYDYIWVLNNDTLVDKNCLYNLLEAMEADSTIAAVSGKILYDEPRDIIWYAGSVVNKHTLKSKHKGDMQKDIGQYDVQEDVPFISGCCMFIRRNSLETVGLFDDNFFAYSEDFDWCLRAKSMALRLCYIPKAKIYHKVSASFKKTTSNKNGGTSSPFTIYLTTRNRLYIIRKHAKYNLELLTATSHFFLWNIYYGTALLALLRITKLKCLVKGIRDGCFDKLNN